MTGTTRDGGTSRAAVAVFVAALGLSCATRPRSGGAVPSEEAEDSVLKGGPSEAAQPRKRTQGTRGPAEAARPPAEARARSQPAKAEPAPRSAARPGAAGSEVEAACLELEKLVGTRDFVAGYEAWRSGKDVRHTVQIAFKRPDRCRARFTIGGETLRTYLVGTNAFSPGRDGKLVNVDFGRLVELHRDAMKASRPELEKVYAVFNLELEPWKGTIRPAAPHFIIQLTPTDNPERPCAMLVEVKFRTGESASFSWLREVASWKDARVVREAGVAGFISAAKLIEVDSSNATLVRMALLKGGEIWAAIERKSYEEKALPDQAFVPGPQERAEAAARGKRTFPGMLVGITASSLCRSLAEELPDDPSTWPDEGKEALGRYLWAVWRNVLARAYDAESCAATARDVIDECVRKVGRLPSEDEQPRLVAALATGLARRFASSLKVALKDLPPTGTGLARKLASSLKLPVKDLPPTEEAEAIKAMSDAACLDVFEREVVPRIQEELKAELRRRTEPGGERRVDNVRLDAAAAGRRTHECRR